MITRVVSDERMRALEKRVAALGIDLLVLMETAGRAVASEVLALGAKKVHVVCGKGNNGGDGLVAARALRENGVHVSVSIVAPGQNLSAQSEIQKRWAEACGVSFTVDIALGCAGADLVIDALLGIGARQPLSPPFAEAVQKMNTHSKRIVAVDVPSGLTEGTVLTSLTSAGGRESVHAERTVTFGALKRAHVSAEGKHASGAIRVAGIGIPYDYFENADGLWLDDAFARAHFDAKTTTPNANKGTFGHAVLIGGQTGKSGALYLASLGAYRVGAGLVTAISPDGSPAGEGALPPEVMHGHTFPEKTTAIGIGPGLGKNESWFKESIKKEKPMCIDADALQFVKDKAPERSVLTPHPLEFTRVFSGDVKTLQARRIDTALEAAKKCGAVVVLKGEGTIVAASDGRWGVCSTGDRALAKGGTGDVLCGVVTGLLAQSYEPFIAACLGVYFHGLAGTIAARGAPASTLASDVANALPEVMRGR